MRISHEVNRNHRSIGFQSQKERKQAENGSKNNSSSMERHLACISFSATNNSLHNFIFSSANHHRVWILERAQKVPTAFSSLK